MGHINDTYVINSMYRSTRFMKCFSLDYKNVDELARDLTNVFDGLANYKDTISSLRFFPIVFPTSDGLGGMLHLGTESTDIAVNGIPDTSQYLYMGEYYVNSYYNDFRDYNDSFQIKVYLPMCGYVDIDPKECIDKWLQFRLFIDYTTGESLYMVGVTDYSMKNVVDDKTSNGMDISLDKDVRIIATFGCNTSIEIPLGSSNAHDIARDFILNGLKIAGSAALSYALKKPVTSVSNTQTVKTYDVHGRGLRKGSVMKQIKSGTETTESVRTTQRNIDRSGLAVNSFEEAVQTINNNIPKQVSDRPNGCNTMISMDRNIHIIMYIKEYVGGINEIYKDNYKHIFGLPLCEVRNVGELHGYTKFGDIHFESSLDVSANIDQATQYEVDLIVSKLKEGIVL